VYKELSAELEKQLTDLDQLMKNQTIKKITTPDA
jgi:hypothetical protein